MKRYFRALFICIAIFVLSGMVSCKDKTEPSAMPGKEENSFAVGDGHYVLTGNDGKGYYLLRLLSEKTFIYYYETRSGKVVPLCGKPNCSHTDDDCDAFLKGAVPHTLQVSDDGIFFWAAEENNLSLFKMNHDGSGHSHVFRLGKEEPGGYYVSGSVIAGDLCYASLVSNNGETGYTSDTMVSVDMKTSHIETLWKCEDPDVNMAVIRNIRVGAEGVFFLVQEEGRDHIRTGVYRYDGQTTERLFETKGSVNVSFTVSEGTLYCADPVKGQTCAISLQDGTSSIISSVTGYGLTSDERYFYLCETIGTDRRVVVYDREWKPADRFESEFDDDTASLFVGVSEDESHISFYRIGQSDEPAPSGLFQWWIEYKIFDKNQIGGKHSPEVVRIAWVEEPLD